MPNNSVKKTSTANHWKKQLEHYTEVVLKFLFGLTVKLGQAREVAKNNYHLGITHLAKGNYSDAVFRFKAVTWLEPGNVEAWYNLGTSYLADQRLAPAVSAYRKTLQMKPDHEEAAYMLAMARGSKATPEELPKKMPRSLVLNHFEGLAPDYSKQQLEVQQYRGHTLMAEAVCSAAAAGRVDHVVLDLGCGSGLCGASLRPVAANIVGVDLSPAMLAQAMQQKDGAGKKVYDELVQREAHEFLREVQPGSYDVVAAGVIFSFIGDITELVSLISRSLKPGGIWVFTADFMEGQGFRFDTSSGRFRFSAAYLRDLVKVNGLNEVRLQQENVYAEYPMWLGVFRK